MKAADCPVEQEIEGRITGALLALQTAQTPEARREAGDALRAAVDGRTPAMKQRMEADRMRRIAEGG
jgi:hypothetical protein